MLQLRCWQGRGHPKSSGRPSKSVLKRIFVLVETFIVFKGLLFQLRVLLLVMFQKNLYFSGKSFQSNLQTQTQKVLYFSQNFFLKSIYLVQSWFQKNWNFNQTSVSNEFPFELKSAFKKLKFLVESCFKKPLIWFSINIQFQAHFEFLNRTDSFLSNLKLNFS